MPGPATGVNARGDLVNNVTLSVHTAVRDGAALDLAVGPYSSLNAAAAWISDDGTTLIGLVIGTGRSQAVVWHC